MVLGCISLIACGGGGEEGGGAPPPNGGTTPAEEEEEEEPPPSGETLSEILGQGTGITSMKYDMVVTAPGTPTTVTVQVWVERNKMRMEMTEEGQTVISLIDYDTHTGYAYMPEQNIAYEVAFNPTIQSAMEEAQSITDYDYDIIGTETIDGKVCLVVEYTEPTMQVTVKVWIWKEYGFPIREEMTTAEGTTITEFKNIDFADIPDSMFELPAGVQIIEMG